MKNILFAILWTAFVMTIIGSVLWRKTEKELTQKINDAWIKELALREVVTPNMEGSFSWNKREK